MGKRQCVYVCVCVRVCVCTEGFTQQLGIPHQSLWISKAWDELTGHRLEPSPEEHAAEIPVHSLLILFPCVVNTHQHIYRAGKISQVFFSPRHREDFQCLPLCPPFWGLLLLASPGTDHMTGTHCITPRLAKNTLGFIWIHKGRSWALLADLAADPDEAAWNTQTPTV